MTEDPPCFMRLLGLTPDQSLLLQDEIPSSSQLVCSYSRFMPVARQLAVGRWCAYSVLMPMVADDEGSITIGLTVVGTKVLSAVTLAESAGTKSNERSSEVSVVGVRREDAAVMVGPAGKAGAPAANDIGVIGGCPPVMDDKISATVILLVASDAVIDSSTTDFMDMLCVIL
jgi:hypothetical protein